MLIMDKIRFNQAAAKILAREHENHGIGTLGEKTIHAVVKNYVEPDEDFHETPLEGYVADVYREGRVFEIQTANFNTMRAKLAALLPLYQVTIVYPVPATKWLRWLDEETGEISERRKSPKRGTPYAVFRELYKIKSFLKEPNLSIHILLIDMEETRLLNGWSTDRKKGSCRHDRIPIGLIEEFHLDCVQDYRMLVPPELQEFTSKEYAKATKLTLSNAQTALNILYYLGIVERVGKKGNSFLYEVTE
ncbi:MAG: hypothetical protein J1F22_01465 [Lachnospiraceae bacterium]|nr:hypothetical protein [Lachnospiraceae bacterium]